MLQDAELAAVTFINADRGWAVGDRGVICIRATAANLEAAKLRCHCRLERFNSLTPITACRRRLDTSYTHETHGVALRTRDGGKTWQSSPELTLPA